MAKINEHYDKLAAGYLFPVVGNKRNEYAARTGKKVMRLDIGDAKLPISPTVARAMSMAADRLSFSQGYSYNDVKADKVRAILHEAGYDKFNGYGDEQGCSLLRRTIAEQHYGGRGVSIDPGEVFVSDGAKCDCANIQTLFGLDNIIAVADPAYPVYVDTNVAAGRTGEFDKTTFTYDGIVYMPCTKEKGFLPQLDKLESGVFDELHGVPDLIYLCSPNNPTGAVINYDQLKSFVDFARDYESVIIFDAAYSEFIKDPNLPRSIYEVEGAKDCAVEIQSFSKSAGFTGVRLGWTVVPKKLRGGKLNSMWNRRSQTFFNGASNIVQAGGLVSMLDERARAESRQAVEIYMGNAKIIRQGLESIGFEVNGGDNAPYLWFNTGMESWAFLDKMLEECQVSCTPGVGFGPSGAGYARLTAFATREDTERAVDSIVKNLKR